MRIWVNPDKMAKLGVTATDVSNAIQAQNRQNPAGAHRPAAGRRNGTDFQYPVNATGASSTAQFDNIVVRAQPDGSLLRLRDLGRAWNWARRTTANFSRLNGRPSAVIIRLSFARRQCGRTGEPRSRIHEGGAEVFSRGHSIRRQLRRHEIRPHLHRAT